MKEQLIQAKSEGSRVIYVDECIFSSKTQLKRSWSNKHESISYHDQRRSIETMALLAGISEEQGLEHYMIKSRVISSDDFIEFLKVLRINNPKDQLTIFMDNLPAHKSRKVQDQLKELKMDQIFNVPYSPQFNGIERYWFLLKQEYKKKILQCMINEEEFEVKNLIQ